MALVLDELLEDAPVTWFLSYNGAPLLPPMRLMELIMDFPQEMPAFKQRGKQGEINHTVTYQYQTNQIPSFANPRNDNGCHILGRVLYVKTSGLHGRTLCKENISPSDHLSSHCSTELLTTYYHTAEKGIFRTPDPNCSPKSTKKFSN